MNVVPWLFFLFLFLLLQALCVDVNVVIVAVNIDNFVNDVVDASPVANVAVATANDVKDNIISEVLIIVKVDVRVIKVFILFYFQC